MRSVTRSGHQNENEEERFFLSSSSYSATPDGTAESGRRQQPTYLTASFKALPALNRGVFAALILMMSPV